MDKCNCRGVRYCLVCLDTERVIHRRGDVRTSILNMPGYSCMLYDHRTGMAYSPPTSECTLTINSPIAKIYGQSHTKDCTDHFVLPGIKLIHNFLSETDEQYILGRIDGCQWVPSQSGRRKQDFGPRVNFKFQKVNTSKFVGLPDYIEILLQRIKERSDGEGNSVLADFLPVELCNLEYQSERLSSIDLHKDDTWIWGNRLISISLNSDCVFTIRHPDQPLLVFIPVPRRSLLCLFDQQRFDWDHGIFPNHISGRRVVITLRELSTSFLNDHELYEQYGKEILEKSSFRIETSTLM